MFHLFYGYPIVERCSAAPHERNDSKRTKACIWFHRLRSTASLSVQLVVVVVVVSSNRPCRSGKRNKKPIDFAILENEFTWFRPYCFRRQSTPKRKFNCGMLSIAQSKLTNNKGEHSPKKVAACRRNAWPNAPVCSRRAIENSISQFNFDRAFSHISIFVPPMIWIQSSESFHCSHIFRAFFEPS